MTELSTALTALLLPLELEQKLSDFQSLFMKWNRNINLSAARSADELELHIVDSLHAIPHLRATPDPSVPPIARVLDVGAGGGLPAVIAAIALPAVHVTALEPVHKKQAFLRTAARELSLNNLEPLAERLDAHALSDYDAAMSRATFDLREWLELGLAYIRPGGLVLGFEAVKRNDLPPGVRRSPYLLSNKTRAIVTLQRAGSHH
jgi:16S rRNA (guanine527-N7)-methyltransferase